MARQSAPCIVWFRDDLRLSDHPALHAAFSAGAPVICLYVLDEIGDGLRPLGGAARWWLAQSLRALQASLAAIGAPLLLRKGPAADPGSQPRMSGRVRVPEAEKLCDSQSRSRYPDCPIG